MYVDCKQISEELLGEIKNDVAHLGFNKEIAIVKSAKNSAGTVYENAIIKKGMQNCMPFFVGQCILHMDLMAAIHIGDGEIFKVPFYIIMERPSEYRIRFSDGLSFVCRFCRRRQSALQYGLSLIGSPSLFFRRPQS